MIKFTDFEAITDLSLLSS